MLELVAYRRAADSNVVVITLKPDDKPRRLDAAAAYDWVIYVNLLVLLPYMYFKRTADGYRCFTLLEGSCLPAI